MRGSHGTLSMFLDGTRCTIGYSLHPTTHYRMVLVSRVHLCDLQSFGNPALRIANRYKLHRRTGACITIDQ
jgi:hypothetical protein